MLDLLSIPHNLAWPFALALAWIAGEFAHRLISIPRISSYGIVGFLLASKQSGFLPPSDGGAIVLLANTAFGLILFELGHRINLRWLRNNPWLGVTSLVEASGTFAACTLSPNYSACHSFPPCCCHRSRWPLLRRPCCAS